MDDADLERLTIIAQAMEESMQRVFRGIATLAQLEPHEAAVARFIAMLGGVESFRIMVSNLDDDDPVKWAVGQLDNNIDVFRDMLRRREPTAH